jgi:hypothetical protein
MSIDAIGRDVKGNLYFIDNDGIYVDLIELGVTKLVGRLTENMNTKRLSLIVHRKNHEKIPWGHLISKYPLDKLKINRIVVILEDRTLSTDWNTNIKKSSSEFTPFEGYEPVYILPDYLFTSSTKHKS